MSWLSKKWNAKPAKKASAPNVMARISKDEPESLTDALNGYLNDYNWIAAKYPFEWLEYIDRIYRFDPSLKKHLITTICLGNPGHDLEISANNEAQAQQAIGLCNDLAARCYPLAGGIDGLNNGLFSQAARAGGLCCEWAPDEKVTRIERAYLPPVRSLRFRRTENGEIELGQLQLGVFVPLNPVQTSYHAVWHEDGNPYPIPPALAALERLSSHKRIMRSVEDWFSKLAAMGFLSLNFERPENLGETEEAYQTKCDTNLTKLSKIVKDNLSSGIVLGYDDMKSTFQNTSAGAGGAKQVAQMVDEDLFAGLGRDPVMFGRSFSRTETWSRVAFEELQREIANIQLGVKRTLEHGHRLNLALQGLGDCGVKVTFKSFGSLDAFRDSEADRMTGDGIRADFTSGICSIEEARRKLGYEDQSAEAGAFVASFVANEYKLRPHKKEVFYVGRPMAAGREEGFLPKVEMTLDGIEMTSGEFEATDEAVANISTVFTWPIANGAPQEIQSAARQYLTEIREMLGEAGSIGVDAVYDWALVHDVPYVEEFVAEAMRLYQEATEAAIEEARLIEIAKAHITTIWNSAQGDPALWGPALPRGAGIGKLFDLPDRKAINYMSEKVDKMYVSKFVSNSPARSKQIQGWLQNQYLEKGLGIGKSPKQLEKFKNEFGDISNRLTDHASRIIIDTGVQRARSWSSIYALGDEGFAEFRISGPSDRLCCKYCRSMLGRTFSVTTERERIENIIDNSEEDISKFSPFITSRYGTKGGYESLKTAKDEAVQKSGMVTPPFHPLCRHSIVAVV